MNLNYLIELLELKLPYTQKELRKHYFKKALEYHPDKNNNNDSNNKFTEINDAYSYLNDCLINNKYHEINQDLHDSSNYLFVIENIVQLFKSSEFNKIKEISNILYQKCDEISISTFEKIDKNMALKIFGYIEQYSELLGIDQTRLNKFREVVNKKFQESEIIILNPSIDNLMESEIYALNHNTEIYYIPLWHDEIIFDNKQSSIIVKCIPHIPKHIYIDESNNIHINVKTSISKAFSEKKITFKIGNKIFCINSYELKILNDQVIILHNKGLSTINLNDMYNNSKKSDIYVNINLY